MFTLINKTKHKTIITQLCTYFSSLFTSLLFMLICYYGEYATRSISDHQFWTSYNGQASRIMLVRNCCQVQKKMMYINNNSIKTILFFCQNFVIRFTDTFTSLFINTTSHFHFNYCFNFVRIFGYLFPTWLFAFPSKFNVEVCASFSIKKGKAIILQVKSLCRTQYSAFIVTQESKYMMILR